MKISRFINNPDKPFHSSGYAEVANEGSMGAASSQSFEQRQRIEKDRQVIGRYRDSYVAHGGDHLQSELRERLNTPQDQDIDPKHKGKKYNRHASSRVYDTRGSTMSSSSKGAAPKLQVPTRKPSFVEPPTRRYNPYK